MKTFKVKDADKLGSDSEIFAAVLGLTLGKDASKSRDIDIPAIVDKVGKPVLQIRAKILTDEHGQYRGHGWDIEGAVEALKCVRDTGVIQLRPFCGQF
jgi:hypothetical protein